MKFIVGYNLKNFFGGGGGGGGGGGINLWGGNFPGWGEGWNEQILTGGLGTPPIPPIAKNLTKIGLIEQKTNFECSF